jgi:hypothetical protein
MEALIGRRIDRPQLRPGHVDVADQLLPQSIRIREHTGGTPAVERNHDPVVHPVEASGPAHVELRVTPVLRASLLNDSRAGREEGNAELVMKEHVDPFTSRGKRNRQLVPQQFSAAAYDYLPDVLSVRVAARLAFVAIEGDVFVPGVQIEESITQFPDVNALSVHIVNGTEHQSDSKRTGGMRLDGQAGRRRACTISLYPGWNHKRASNLATNQSTG